MYYSSLSLVSGLDSRQHIRLENVLRCLKQSNLILYLYEYLYVYAMLARKLSDRTQEDAI
jgi:hypothetical protein